MRRLSFVLILSIHFFCCWGQDSYMSMLKASALRSVNNQAEAINVLTSALLTSQSAGLYCERGEAYLSAGMIKDAISDFSAAESLSPGKGLYGLSKCAAVKGDARGAMNYLEALMKTSCKKAESEIVLDSSFTSVMASSEWKEFWRKEWYKGYEKSRWTIEYYIKAGRIDLAREEYNSLAAVYPDTETTDYCKALIEIASGNPASAIDYLSGITGGEPLVPEYVIALAEAHCAAANYYAAAAEYGKLIKAEYNDASLFLLRGEMFKKAGDRDAAIKDFEVYLSFFPDDYKALSLIGKTLAENGSLYLALPYMNKNIEINPGRASAYSARGDAYFSCRSWENAIADYSMSLDLNPGDGAVYLSIGVAMINSGNSADACSFLRKALQLGNRDAVKYLSRYCNN